MNPAPVHLVSSCTGSPRRRTSRISSGEFIRSGPDSAIPRPDSRGGPNGPDPQRMFSERFRVELADPAHLGQVLQTVRNVEGVFDVERVTA